MSGVVDDGRSALELCARVSVIEEMDWSVEMSEGLGKLRLGRLGHVVKGRLWQTTRWYFGWHMIRGLFRNML